MGEHGEEFCSLLFEDLSQRDVTVQPLHAAEATVLMAEEARPNFHWDDTAILVDEFCLINRREPLESECPVSSLFFLGGGGRSRDLTEVLADQFLPRPTEHYLYGSVHTGDYPVERDRENSIAGVLKERAVAGLACPQRFFRSLTFRQVTRDDQACQGDEGQG